MNMDEAHPSPPVLKKTSGLAIASLVTALTCIAPVAILLGHFALSRIALSSGRLTGRGIALAGTIIGYVTLVSYFLSIPILFVGARAWKRGSDRAACIITQRNLQQAVRGYQSMNGLPTGSPLDIKAVLADLNIENIKLTCPATREPLQISETIPPTGELVVKCPHAHDLDHKPKDQSTW